MAASTKKTDQGLEQVLGIVAFLLFFSPFLPALFAALEKALNGK